MCQPIASSLNSTELRGVDLSAVKLIQPIASVTQYRNKPNCSPTDQPADR